MMVGEGVEGMIFLVGVEAAEEEVEDRSEDMLTEEVVVVVELSEQSRESRGAVGVVGIVG